MSAILLTDLLTNSSGWAGTNMYQVAGSSGRMCLDRAYSDPAGPVAPDC